MVEEINRNTDIGRGSVLLKPLLTENIDPLYPDRWPVADPQSDVCSALKQQIRRYPVVLV
jgi:hypothetical protein